MKKKINQILVILLVAMILPSCDSKNEFNSIEWNKKGVDWWMSDFREKMVNDLIQSDTLIGMNREQVKGLLGPPKSENYREIEYLVREKYGADIDPVYISNLHIEFNEQGYVRNCEIRK